MLKFVESAVTFSEYPDEIALCLNLSLCPNNCKGCSESYLAGDIGEELTEDLLDQLINKHPGITLIGFMGGDNDHERIAELVDYIHLKYNLKVGMYSGRDFFDTILLARLDYYKIGSWIMPEGPVEEWYKTNCGPITFTFSNQLLFKRIENSWINITNKLRKNNINNLEKEIIK